MPPLPSARGRSHQSGQPQAELLQAVLTRAGIQTWDLLLIGDGSGSGWDGACGWSSTLIDRQTRERYVFFGAANQGSVNLAELMPYFQALLWFHNHVGMRRIKGRGFLTVHVITDSQVTATHGKHAATLGDALPKVPQRALWAGMRELAHMGYHLHWHWAMRSSNSLNVLADLIAALARRRILALGQEFEQPGYDHARTLTERAMRALDKVRFVDPLDGTPINVHALNPSETEEPSGSASSDNQAGPDH